MNVDSLNVKTYSQYIDIFKSDNKRMNKRETLARNIIEEENLKEGEISTVLKIIKYQNINTSKNYVVKVTDNKEKSLNEIKIANLFDNSHIVKIHSYFENKQKNYLIRDCIEGDSLKNFFRIHEEKKIPLIEAKKIISQIFSTLCLFLEKNIIPGPADLSFDNLIIGNDGHVTFINFELCTLVEPQDESFLWPSYLNLDIKAIFEAFVDVIDGREIQELKQTYSDFEFEIEKSNQKIAQKIEVFSFFSNKLNV